MSYDLPIRTIRAIFDEALLAVDPYKAVRRQCGHVLSLYGKEKLTKLYVAGFGKAAPLMMRAVADGAGALLTRGIVITKYGHMGEHRFAGNIAVHESGHPVPDENGARAAGEVLKLLKQADEETLVLFLISGGGSALLCRPYEGISLAEKQTVTELLLKAGADIHELNSVRKHISAIKGGRLAEVAYPARMIALVLSDVIGDPLDVIASGPASPDTSTYADALEVVRKYGLAARMPLNVMHLLTKGAQGYFPETPKKGAPVFDRVDSVIVGSNATAVDAAKTAAERSGYEVTVISTQLTGEASHVGKDLAQAALDRMKIMNSGEKVCLIAGGGDHRHGYGKRHGGEKYRTCPGVRHGDTGGAGHNIPIGGHGWNRRPYRCRRSHCYRPDGIGGCRAWA